MKKIIISAISILIISSVCKSQISYDKCGTVMQDTTQLLPAYLSEDWLSVKNVEFAVLYVDFPDGRVNGTLQPFFDYQLAEVADTDAVAEIGTIVNQNGDTVLKCAKYSYFDRWNMYFDSLGNYLYDAHPDWQSHKDSAWGSMKEYWREVTNNKLNVVPARIRQNSNGDPRLNSGIINNFTEIEPGRYIIKSIRLRKPKYGANGSGYFPEYPFTHAEGYNSIWGNGNGDAFQILDSLRIAHPQEYPFDHRQFMAQGGKIIIVIAGGGSGTGGMTLIGANSMIVRGRTYPLVNRSDIYYSNLNWLNRSTIDAFGISAHEMGHALFGWRHTEAGRYDLMTGNTVWNVNCPPHPNPIYKMKQGWLDPIALEHSQDLDSLGAIENTHQCGVLTIFGKPSGSPNWSSGECYVLENRRRIGFDRKLIDTSFFNRNPDFRAFKGGLLIWHYSPYFQINGFVDTIHGVDATIRLRTPEASDTNLANDRFGHVQHFFAYLPGQPATYYHFPEARTFHVAGGFATGLEISDISQTGDLIGMSINYNIKEPTVYSGVIYNRSLSNHVTEFSDTIFYHEYDKYGYFRIREGSVVEGIRIPIYGSGYGEGERFLYNSFEIAGSSNLPLTFKGAGRYSIDPFKIAGIKMTNLNKFDSVDSLHLNNIKFDNLVDSTTQYAQLLLERRLDNLPPLLIMNNPDIPRIDISCHALRELTFGKSNLQDAVLYLNGGSYLFKDKFRLLNSLITQENNSSPFDMLFIEPESQLSALNSTIQAKLDTVYFGNGATLKAHESQFLFQNFGTTLLRGFEFSNSGNDSNIKYSLQKMNFPLFGSLLDCIKIFPTPSIRRQLSITN